MLTSSSNTNRTCDSHNFRVLQETGMGGKSGVDAFAGGKHAERVAATIAVTRRDDLLDTRRLQVSHRRDEDGIRRMGSVSECKLCRVETRRGEVHGGWFAVKHVRGDD